MEINGTVACGTTKHNRLNPPKTKTLLHGEHSFRRDRNPLMIQYQDKKEIYFSINYSSSEISIFRKKKKNDWGIQVNRCNHYMGGIDRNDAMLWNYSSVRKSHKWRTQLAFHFMKEALLNSVILYNKVVGNERLLISCQSKLLSISLQNLVGIFLSWYLNQEGKPILQKHVQYVQRMRNIKKADTSAKIVPKTQDFV